MRILDPAVRNPGRILGIFLETLVQSTELSQARNGGKISISDNKNKSCVFLILVRVWTKKRWLGSRHKSVGE